MLSDKKNIAILKKFIVRYVICIFMCHYDKKL